MFILDDFLLGAVVLCFIMMVFALSSGFLCLISGLFLIAGGSENIIEGGAGKKTKPKKENTKKENTKKENATKENNMPLISTKNFNKTFDILDKNISKYGYAEPDQTELKRQSQLIDLAKSIYKKEKGDIKLFDFNYKKMLGAYASEDYLHTSFNDDKNITPDVIKKLMFKRTLDDEYPMTTSSAYSGWNIKHIEYEPKDKQEFENLLHKVYEYAIISSVRTLKDKESQELKEIIRRFDSGELTHPKISIHFYDREPHEVYNCKSYNINRPYSDKYKKLHWGQRKLLLSEIDFFNRVAQEIGADKFKESQIALVYPGAAHGHHLLIEMEMYPSLVLYLWDPSYYNDVLYLADFLRRKIPIPYQYSEKNMEMAKRYEGRVFINMELPNDIYLIYWTNATTDKTKNYGPEYGFFTKKSADYYLQYIKKQKTESFTLFASDIRLYTNDDALNMLARNNIVNYGNSIALKIASEKMRHEDHNRDMDLQREWLEFVKADYGLFKFKIKPKHFINEQPAQYEYPSGEIILQVWGPIATNETRLFVKPDRKPAYYNVMKYNDKMKTFNIMMRTHDMRNVTLKELNIHVSDNPDATIDDVWSPVLYDGNLIGQDAILETYILYDYLSIYKDKNKIKATDLTLAISDITMTLLKPLDQRGILGYFKDYDPEEILSARYDYHKTFTIRLDYNSSMADKKICQIEREGNKDWSSNNKNNWKSKKNKKWQN